MRALKTSLFVAATIVAGAAFGAEPAAPQPAPATETAQPAPATNKPAASDQRPAVSNQGSPAARDAQPAANSQTPRRNGTDRLDLDTTVVTGNRELPKVLYIVPWKKADIGDLPAQPFNSLIDEVLTPVDRDVFRREVTYYDAIAVDKQAQPQNPTAAPGAK
jgi:hypothetical protein